MAANVPELFSRGGADDDTGPAAKRAANGTWDSSDLQTQSEIPSNGAGEPRNEFFCALKRIEPATCLSQDLSDTAKNAIGRLSALEAPGLPDDEQTFTDLRDRIAKTVAFLESVKSEDLNGSETREVTLNFPNLKVTFSGEAYLLQFVLPNFYFHVTTAYDILRHKGVPIGKADFIGRLG